MDQFLKDELRKLIRKATRLVDRDSFGQEPNYTAAFFGKIHGESISSPSGYTMDFNLKLHASISNDRGPGSAESLTGVDIGLVFQWVDKEDEVTYEKAILLQAKNDVEKLTPKEREALLDQCALMEEISKSNVVMDCPYDCSVPNIYEVDRSGRALIKPPIALDDYLIDFVFPCTRGDDDKSVVARAKRSDRLVTVKTDSPKPVLKQKIKSKIKPK